MASRVALLLWASVFLATAACSQGYNNVVVGSAKDGWKVPVQPDRLNLWSSIHRFQIGDNLVFKYNYPADSVVEVTRDDYNRCSIASPLATHKAAAGTGHITVPLPRSGPFYFISGRPGSCQMGECIIVIVLSEKHNCQGFFVPAAALSIADGLVGGHAPLPAPDTGGAAGKTAGSDALLLGAAVLGAVLVGWKAPGHRCESESFSCGRWILCSCSIQKMK